MGSFSPKTSTQETNLQSAAARSRLAERAEPYYRNVQQGLALGYRRGRRGGTWLARIRHPHQSSYCEVKLGRADDEGVLADGDVTLTYDQAVKAARGAQAHEDAKRVSGVLPGAGKLTVMTFLMNMKRAIFPAMRAAGKSQDVTLPMSEAF